MKILIDRAIPGATGIWTAPVDPQQLLKLAKPIRQGGQLSVVFITKPTFYADRQGLEFDLGAAELLNLGSGNEALFIDSRAQESTSVEVQTDSQPRNVAQGDALFLKGIDTLPDSVKELGRQLLGNVRRIFPGELHFHPKSQKFVESPNNFWVVRIQPRDKSLRLTVYGSPNAHPNYRDISLVNDMAGYSAFKLNQESQLADAISAIKTAQRLKAGF